MFKIETEYHVTSSSVYNDLPKYKCHGKCKKVWWKNDIEDEHENAVLMAFKCPMCDGQLKLAKKGDYKIIEFRDEVPKSGQVQYSHLSQVKDEFEQYAKDNWC